MSKTKSEKCRLCNGTGMMERLKVSFTCTNCGGKGEVVDRYSLSKRKWVRV